MKYIVIEMTDWSSTGRHGAAVKKSPSIVYNVRSPKKKALLSPNWRYRAYTVEFHG